MSDPETRTAAPTGIGSGGDVEVTGSGFTGGTYRSPAPWTMPSPEGAGRIARVIPHAGRLFVVETFREPRP